MRCNLRFTCAWFRDKLPRRSHPPGRPLTGDVEDHERQLAHVSSSAGRRTKAHDEFRVPTVALPHLRGERPANSSLSTREILNFLQLHFPSGSISLRVGVLSLTVDSPPGPGNVRCHFIALSQFLSDYIPKPLRQSRRDHRDRGPCGQLFVRGVKRAATLTWLERAIATHGLP